MRGVRKTFAVFALLVLASPAYAAGGWSPVVVTRVAVDSNGIAFIKVDTSTSLAGSTPPACATNGLWQTVFDAKTETGQAMLSIALSAKLSKKPVRLLGTNLCNVYSTVESTYVIDILEEN